MKKLLLIEIAFAGALAWAQTPQTTLSPIRIILVGDSTMAVKSGYGPGFCADVVPQVACLDMAKGGRSSASYRAEGSWAEVMDALSHNAYFRGTYVLIQFGHNDQPGKPGRSTDLATEFPANLRHYVEDVRSTGAKPILVTPLARRAFANGQVKNDLSAWADATKKVAREEAVSVLDLNTESVAAVQKMGPAAANSLAMAPPSADIAAAASTGNSASLPKKPVPPNNVSEPKGEAAPVFDYTHVGDKGSAYFGRMVANELVNAVPDLRPYFRP